MERSVNVNAHRSDPFNWGTAAEPDDSTYDASEPAADYSSDPPPWFEARSPQPIAARESDSSRSSGTPQRTSPPPLKALQVVDQGPCLYFGPSGQRCNRRALEGGFCSRHQPADRTTAGASGGAFSIPEVSKRALGVAGILAVLWPILADLIREILRLLR